MVSVRIAVLGIVVWAALACSDHAEQPGSVTGKAAGSPTMPSVQGVGGSPDAAAEPPDDLSCHDLSRAAALAYNAQLESVPFCEVDGDCTRAFLGPNATCWAECVYTSHGSAVLEAAEIAAMESDAVTELCSKFEAKGCMVQPPGCPLGPDPEPVELKCEIGACVVVEAQVDDESSIECPASAEVQPPKCTDVVEPIDGKFSDVARERWSSAPEMSHEVLIVVAKTFAICPRPECSDGARQCPETDAYAAWLERAYLTSQTCVRARIAEVEGSASPDALLGNGIVANLTWSQIQSVAATPDVISIGLNETDTPPP